MKPFGVGDKVTVDGALGEIAFVRADYSGANDHKYRVTDLGANDPYKQTRLENGNFINHSRIKKMKASPMPRKYRGKYPRRIASTSSAVKDGVYVFMLNDGSVHRIATRDLIAAGYQKQAPQPGEDFDFVLTALEATRKTNPAKRPAPKKRALSRPSQVTKKAPTKRLVARRKIAAKKPVKGHFPNPRKAEKLVTLQIEIDRGKGWEFYTNFQHGKSHVRAITEMAKDAAQHAAKMNPSWMVRVIKK